MENWCKCYVFYKKNTIRCIEIPKPKKRTPVNIWRTGVSNNGIKLAENLKDPHYIMVYAEDKELDEPVRLLTTSMRENNALELGWIKTPKLDTGVIEIITNFYTPALVGVNGRIEVENFRLKPYNTRLIEISANGQDISDGGDIIYREINYIEIVIENLKKQEIQIEASFTSSYIS